MFFLPQTVLPLGPAKVSAFEVPVGGATGGPRPGSAAALIRVASPTVVFSPAAAVIVAVAAGAGVSAAPAVVVAIPFFFF